MKYLFLFLLLLLSWMIISSITLESFLIGVTISSILCFAMQDVPSLRSFHFFLYSYLRKIPKSVFEAFELLINILNPHRVLLRRIVDISTEHRSETELTINMLTITLTPKTIAFDFSEDTVFIHEVFFKDD